MTRCVEFYKKWEKEPNFCGLGSTERKRVGKYIGFVKNISDKHGLEEGLIYTNVPCSAVTKLIDYGHESEMRKRIDKYIVGKLKDNKALTAKTINAAMGITTMEKPLKPTKQPCVINPPTKNNNDITAKNKALLSLFPTGVQNSLRDIMAKTNSDNEYSANIKAIIWAQERLEKENDIVAVRVA